MDDATVLPLTQAYAQQNTGFNKNAQISTSAEQHKQQSHFCMPATLH